MSVRIQFDKPTDWHFTNLDFVTGKVILILQADAAISAINVKLEGESRTRLAGPKTPHNDRSDKKRTELEVHKLLYKVVTVFPSTEIQGSSPTSPQYTLLAGHYEYPFTFKFPFNNNCSTNTNLLRDLKLGSLSVQYAPNSDKHVKKTLPPTLSGFPGEADIKYYVKATVVRPKFYQENIRHRVDIKFLPIEPPRPPHRHEENFARRKQQFQKYASQPARRSLFRKTSIPEAANGEQPPIFQVDARLPHPAILTCNEPLPLRILVQKLNDTPASAHLSTLQIELIAHTHVRAHDLTRTETSSWIIVSLASMKLPLGNPNEKGTKEWKVPARFWDDQRLPNTVAPSFDTCNISRSYELEVRVGLAHSIGGGMMPELIVLPLRLPVKVYSGVAPPPDLLRAMAAQTNPFHMPNTALPQKSQAQVYEPQTPVTPTYEQSQYPPQLGSYEPTPITSDADDAPPSYEDAMADDIGPVDGPRRDYTVPEDPELRENAFNSDSKGPGGLARRVSERLFVQNAPSQLRRSTFGAPPTMGEADSVQEESTAGEGLEKEPQTLSQSSTRS